MVHFSPLGATFGVRVDQLMETSKDYFKYHDKLNRKLQKLRHRFSLTTKDTKKYSAKCKYPEFSSKDFEKDPLAGTLVLLHSERDLALVETLKLRARERGHLKKSEKKVLSTRLKKIQKTNEKLLNMSVNEKIWSIRIQYLIYSKLAHVEYLLYGKYSKTNKQGLISNLLALSFAALLHLEQLNLLDSTLVEWIKSRYEYTLKQHAQGVFSSIDVLNFIKKQVSETNKDDELVQLLLNNGYDTTLPSNVQESTKSKNIPTEINWRAFTAKIRDMSVAESINTAKTLKVKNITDYDSKLLKWQLALERQESYINNHDESNDDMDVDEEEEFDQILLAYIKYNILSTSISRDNFLFIQLLKQWSNLSTSSTSFASKLNKFKEIERIVKNLSKFLQDIMELPGVYSDDDLLAQLDLAKTYYQCYLSSVCLGQLYQTKGKYLDSLALHVDAQQKIDSKLKTAGDFQEIIVSKDLLSQKKLDILRNSIKDSWNSIIALAEYEKKMNQPHADSKYKPSIIESVSANRVIKPTDIKLDNLFPVRPKLKPTGAKPTLFDLAFNYLSYEDESAKCHIEKSPNRSSTSSITQNENQESSAKGDEPAKPRRFLGLFGR
ncbi:hypothetical protein TBLA_0A02290 [Henningerozyma blattae CBS 6284]|uniref:Signal recognition particle subunit SRP68 n=1 Tax=Henningerozyma blattae (strain ATCC 34711 / CBS 6284 / DSM 70876 / NBRC 10599 / NRRL Y-10934 / UCD 77-7) TaxID=1071380 RepID=I2GV77_HENB6|nr:hypothetical protein TBLA_0A02290 [Tetrapisispora blattae CBS 6284]CCH58029.1 hypothetical protein TBLA_0A02290 [Tetrapisispora blattae CBS 6284]